MWQPSGHGESSRRRVPAVLGDAALAVVFLVVSVVELTRPVEEMHARGPLWLDVILQTAFCATLVLRSSRPRTALVAMSAVYLLPSLATAHAQLFFGDFVPLLLVTYTVARYAAASWSRWSWLTGVVFWVGLMIRSGRYFHEVSNPVLPVGIAVVVWAIGRVLRRLAEQRAQLEGALARLAAEQTARERLVVSQERARIAAEMHDVVAHAVSLMVVQVGNARMGLERSGRPRPRLRAAEQSGRQALVELRRSLGVLRSGPGTGPLPDLTMVDGLAEGMRTAGLEVQVRGDHGDDVPASVQLAAYRVLQEALTNALAHGVGPAVITLSREPGRLVVEVRNPLGPRHADVSDRSGHGGTGLLGMRERVELFEGTLVAHGLGDRFEVRAVFPLQPPDPGPDRDAGPVLRDVSC